MTLVEEVLTASRRAQLCMPDTVVVERDGWYQVSTPSLTQGAVNEVVTWALDERDADRVVDETLAGYAGRRFRWSVLPGAEHLVERLAGRGLVRGEVWGMARDTSPIDAPPDVAVERAAGPEEFAGVMAEGWEMDGAPLEQLHRIAFADRRFRFCLARAGGEAGGCASYCALGTSAYLMGGVVLPRFRRRGLYRAMVSARLRDAAAEGIPLAVTHARASTSGPLLAHLGFEVVCRFPCFSPP